MSATRRRAPASWSTRSRSSSTAQHGQIALCHNGNLVNAAELREALSRDGAIFQTSSDTEVILHLYARSKAAHVEDALDRVARPGPRRVLARARDDRPADRGARPARLPAAGARPARATRPWWPRKRARWTSSAPPGCATSSRARSSSSTPPASGRSSRSRRPPWRSASSSTSTSRGPTATCSARASTPSAPTFGRLLAQESPVDADVVVPVPDSGVCAATGFAEEAGIPLRMGLIRNHYVGRTFIEPQQSIRHFGVKVKLNPVRSILDGQRVVLVDDSIVRGTTSRKIVRMIKAAGAREVHVRISCPPTISPCFYGVDTPRRVRADRGDPHARGDPEVPGGRLPALPEPRGAARRRELAPVRTTARRATRATTRCRSRGARRRSCSSTCR